VKGPIPVCVARCLSKEIGNALRAVLVAVCPVRFGSYMWCVSPSQISEGLGGSLPASIEHMKC